MRPCLVKQQSFLLSELRISPMYCILMRVFQVFLYGTILGFVKSHEVSSTQFSSSIGVHHREKHGLSSSFETLSSGDD